jgi:hypothetical protein
MQVAQHIGEVAMAIIDDTTLTGEVRAEVSFARDNGHHVDREIALMLAIADLLQLPDETRFADATCAAMDKFKTWATPERISEMREAALVAGYPGCIGMLHDGRAIV